MNTLQAYFTLCPYLTVGWTENQRHCTVLHTSCASGDRVLGFVHLVPTHALVHPHTHRPGAGQPCPCPCGLYIYIRRKVRIWTILGFCCTNLGSEDLLRKPWIHTQLSRIAQPNLGHLRILLRVYITINFIY